MCNWCDPKNPKNTTQTEVETGMRGVDGYVEILSGLKEGDIVVASPNIKREYHRDKKFVESVRQRRNENRSAPGCYT